MQANRPRIDGSKIDKFAGKAREHLGIVHHGIEIVHSLQLSGQMKCNFDLARLDVQGGVPCSPSGAIKPIEFVRPKISKCSIYEVCMRQTADQFASLKSLRSLLLSSQAPAGRTFNFGKVVLISLAYKLQQHGIAQTGGRDKPNRPFQRNARDGERHGRHRPPRKAST